MQSHNSIDLTSFSKHIRQLLKDSIPNTEKSNIAE